MPSCGGSCHGCLKYTRRLLFPSGVVFGAVTAGLILSIHSVWLSCRFFQVYTKDGTGVTSGLFQISHRHDTCLPFWDIPSDWVQFIHLTASTKAARLFGAVATMVGSLAAALWIFVRCLACTSPAVNHKLQRAIGHLLVVAAICQALTFLVFVQVYQRMSCTEDTTTCSMGFGGISSLLAVCFYLLGGLTLVGTDWVKRMRKKDDDPNNDSVLLSDEAPKTKWAMFWFGVLARMRLVYPKQAPLWAGQGRWQDIALLVVSILVFTVSLSVVLGCRFFVAEFEAREYEEGLFYYYYYPDNECRRFERGSLVSFTGMTKAAQVMGLLATVLGGVLMVILWTIILIVDVEEVETQTLRDGTTKPTSRWYSWLPIISLMAGLAQGCTFLSNKERKDLLCYEELENQSCSIGADGVTSALNMCAYLFFAPCLWWYQRNHIVRTPDNYNVENDLELNVEDSLVKGEIDSGDQASTAEQAVVSKNEEVAIETENVKDL